MSVSEDAEILRDQLGRWKIRDELRRVPKQDGGRRQRILTMGEDPQQGVLALVRENFGKPDAAEDYVMFSRYQGRVGGTWKTINAFMVPRRTLKAFIRMAVAADEAFGTLTGDDRTVYPMK